MFNPLKLFQTQSTQQQSLANDEPADQLPCPDILRDPQYIHQLLRDLSHPTGQTHLLALFENSRAAVNIWDVKLHPERLLCDFAVTPQLKPLLGKHLTIIANWHEYRIAFSSQIVSQYNLHRYAFEFPAEIIRLAGRNFYRVLPIHPTQVVLSMDTLQLKVALHDISEGGMGIDLTAIETAHLQARVQQKLIIQINGQSIGVSRFSLSNIQATDAQDSRRVGVIFTEMSQSEQFKLRRLLLQLQSRH